MRSARKICVSKHRAFAITIVRIVLGRQKGVANDMEADKRRADCSSRDEVVE